MKNSEIRDLTILEVEEKVEEMTMSLTKTKLNHAVSPLENPQQIRSIRKDIARLNTELRRREIESEVEQIIENQ